MLALHLRAHGVPEPVREHRFDAVRRWRFDFSWPWAKVAVEVEGGTWSGGRHTRPSGFAADLEKYNAAALAGWRVLRFDGHAVKSGQAALVIAQLFEGRNIEGVPV